MHSIIKFLAMLSILCGCLHNHDEALKKSSFLYLDLSNQNNLDVDNLNKITEFMNQHKEQDCEFIILIQHQAHISRKIIRRYKSIIKRICNEVGISIDRISIITNHGDHFSLQIIMKFIK